MNRMTIVTPAINPSVGTPYFGAWGWNRKSKPQVTDLFDPKKFENIDPKTRQKLSEKLGKQHRANNRFRRLAYGLMLLSSLSIGGTGYLGIQFLKTMSPPSIESTYEEGALSEEQLSARGGLGQTLAKRYEALFNPWAEQTQLLAEYAKPAVVEVGGFAEGQPEHGQLRGTGFFVTPQGHLVTNAHVVGNDKTVMITLLNGKKARGEVLQRNKALDLAIIKIQPEAFGLETVPDLRLATDDIKDATWVMAIGHGAGKTWTSTMGVISSTNRKQGLVTEVLQTDAAINGGNSGGPLLNMKGEVVGINSSGALFSDNMGFSVTAKELRRWISLISRQDERLPDSL